jgi:glycosyltransferase involved in cell wall biosynthesis
MKVDIFIKSYKNDFKWLKYSLQSLAKYVTGYNEIIIIIPEGERHLINFPLPERTFVHTIEERGNGYLFQQYAKMIAHHYCSGDYVMYLDSDCIFHSPVNIEDLIKDGKPQILMTNYKELEGSPWQKPTAEFLGKVPEFEFMRRHCFIYHRQTLANLEKWFKKDLKEYILSRPGGTFSEFNVIGFFAYLFERDRYNFIDTKDWAYVPAIVNQYHSYTQFEEKEQEIIGLIKDSIKPDYELNGQVPFEGDTFIRAEIEKLKEKFKLKTCIETGTQFGSTTNSFCEIFDKVITIEAEGKYLEIAKEKVKHKNVLFVHGKSEEVLDEVIQDNALYYLDAHGCATGGCPLKKELEIIKGKKNICIVIHDFKVPEKDFGFDSYDFDLSYEEIEQYLNVIYPEGFNYHYNEEANGANRGIIYIYPL